MRKISFIAAALTMWLVLPLPGHALEAGCVESYRADDIDASLLACTLIIEAGQAGKADLAVARANRAFLYLVKGDLDAADRDTAEALVLDRDHAPAHVARAAVLTQKGFLDRALVEASAAIKLDPKNERAYNYRGIVEDDLSQIGGEKAVRVGDLVVANPSSWRVRAINDFSQAINLNPNESNYYVDRGSVLAQNEQYAQAIPDGDKVKALAPERASSWNTACWFRAIWGQELETALADCGKALAMAPASGPVLESLCLVKFRMGQYAEAIQDCTAALKINQKSAGSFYVRGLALAKSGQGGSGDIAAAQRLQPYIDDEYANYGVKP